MRTHNYFIDMMRFFAAMMVVLFHLNQAIPHVDNWYRNMVKSGWLGVPMFFVISGYCIIVAANNSKYAAEFLIRRFFRIFPPYWASLIIVLLAASFQKLYIGASAVHHIPRTVAALTATLSLTTSPLTHISTMNWVYWTLTCELFFYLNVGLVLLFNKKFMPGLLLAISIFAAIAPLQKSGLLFFLDQWPAFGLGAGIYYYVKNTAVNSRLWFIAILLANGCGLIGKFGFSGYTAVTSVTVILIIASQYLNFQSNIFSKLGQHAYSVYLVHVPVGVFILGLFEPDFIRQWALANLIYDLFVYGIICLIAWMVYKFVEMPSIITGKKLAKKHFHTTSIHISE